jgi:hypothetical protein
MVNSLNGGNNQELHHGPSVARSQNRSWRADRGGESNSTQATQLNHTPKSEWLREDSWNWAVYIWASR